MVGVAMVSSRRLFGFAPVERKSVSQLHRLAALLAAGVVIAALSPMTAEAAEPGATYTTHSEGRQASHVVVTLNKSRVIQFNQVIAQIEPGDVDPADEG